MENLHGGHTKHKHTFQEDIQSQPSYYIKNNSTQSIVSE